VSYRTLDRLFGIAGERAETCTVDINISMLEIYNEQILDLLAGPRCDEKKAKCVSLCASGGESSVLTDMPDRLDVRTGPQGNTVPGLTVVRVDSIDQVIQAMAHGNANRATGATNMNEHSSRSHWCAL
jgi:kinesin family protein C2/C3